MRIELQAVAKGRRAHVLPTTTVAYESGQATLARAETEQRPTVLGLIAAGRMRPDSGAVTIDDRTDAAAIRRRVALVDAPSVSDPAPDITVAGVAAEELMFAGIPSNPIAVANWLADLGLTDVARIPISNVDPRERLHLLTELAILRDGVEGLVIVAPDRHGGDPVEWWDLARSLADRGFAVLVIAGDASAAALAANTMLARMQGDEPDESAEHDVIAEGGLA
ncbi:hypothetical protein SAMN05428970_3795 [Agromyces sp. CF514]|uniref:hypothetical protein n=1 Tax=Agromyces sp. CF514 TaxID=1881031 RepID=UPI0008EAE3B8|nr:hypothetical protein [Agromyces sp. CF514]SFR91421.1 hypothetical protein SAMN05428970_3795 [Agromyces sp. CF514]